MQNLLSVVYGITNFLKSAIIAINFAWNRRKRGKNAKFITNSLRNRSVTICYNLVPQNGLKRPSPINKYRKLKIGLGLGFTLLRSKH